ncbi:MAG: hypothetical protein ACT4PW_06610, partial [Acidimicrobiia bacterium]
MAETIGGGSRPPQPICVVVPCAVCAKEAGYIELTPPHHVPEAWSRQPPDASRRARRRASTRWWLVF